MERFLFNPEAYFQRVEAVLGTHRDRYDVESEIQVTPPDGWDGWRFVSWKARVVFATGDRLEISEYYSREAEGQVGRCVSYHFRDAEDRCVFRIDTHGDSSPLDTPCHIHLGEGEDRYEHGDARLHGFDLEGVDFLGVFRLIFGHEKGRKFPWEQE